jgi:uncharacterized membrane protein AbrB (regulator of aidB expression)
VALGARFTPDFARAALGPLGRIAVAAGFGAPLGAAAGLHPATGVLAVAPGGIAKMCITAKVLQLGVPLVTAFHALRHLAVLSLTEPLFRRERRRLGPSSPCAP